MAKILLEIDDTLYEYIKAQNGYDEHLDKRFDYQIRFAVQDGIALPDNATNGEVISRLFSGEYGSNGEFYHAWIDGGKSMTMTAHRDWWNSPYKGEQK